MRVYVFGAGASKGSQPPDLVKERVAPLMDELFMPQYRRFAREVGLDDGDLVQLESEINDTPIENWLTAEWDRVEGYGTQRRQAGRTRLGYLAFYIWRLFLEVSLPPGPSGQFAAPRGVNHYRTLLEHLTSRDEEFGLISFNYDTLLDQAVQVVLGADLSSPESYHKAQLLKPHGSVNWILERRPSDPEIAVAREHIPDYLARFRLASGRMLGGPVETNVDRIHVIPPGHHAMQDYKRVFGWIHNSYFYPLLMLPLLTKRSSDLHSWLPEQPIGWAHTMLGKVDDIYVVGYRARDDIFAEMLKAVRNRPRLHVVGREDGAREIAERISNQRTNLIPGTIYDGGFQAYVEAGSP